MIEIREQSMTESMKRYLDDGFVQYALEQVGVDGRKTLKAFLAYRYPSNLKDRNVSKATPEHGTHRSSPGCVLEEGDAFHDQDGLDEKNDSSSCLGMKEELVGVFVVEQFWGALHIKYAMVSKSYRKQGIGSMLMKKALAYGKEVSCPFAFVETMSFQALPFYEKHGFHLDFTRSGFSEGVSLYYMSRSLN